MTQLPEPFQAIGRAYPVVMESYERLAAATHDAGPLDERTRRLIKLGTSSSGVEYARPAGRGW